MSDQNVSQRTKAFLSLQLKSLLVPSPPPCFLSPFLSKVLYKWWRRRRYGPNKHFRFHIRLRLPNSILSKPRRTITMVSYAQPAAANYYTHPSHPTSKSRGHRLCDDCGVAESPSGPRFRLCGGCMTTQYCVRFSLPFRRRSVH